MKKIGIFLALLFIGLSIWYLFFKTYDYQIRFSSNQPKGVVYSYLLANEYDKTIDSIYSKPYFYIEQTYHNNDSLYALNWEIETDKKNVQQISLKAKDVKHSMYQKFHLLFGATDFSEKIKSIAQAKKQALEVHEKEYKLSKIDTAELNIPFYVYVSSTSTIPKKALAMMNTILTPMEYIKGNNLQISSNPFLYVTHWNEEKMEIDFNFCFPLENQDKFPETDKVKFASNYHIKALHCTFNGDYRYSEAAWYYLLEFARSKAIAVKLEPIEIYLNDPHSGGDPLSWKAEIYLPLKN